MKKHVVVVTGASSGVGRAVARAYGARNAQVALVARGGDGLEGARKDVEQAGGKALVLPADVAVADEVEAAAAGAEKAFGPIDVWVNNAMTTVFSEFVDISPEEYRRATETTYLGFVWGTQAALRRMLPRDRGTIVQVGSALAYQGIPLQSAYCGSKHAIKGFTESLRCELRHRHSRVRVTMVQLPGLNTPQFDHCRSKLPKQPMPVPPIYQPEVAAEAVLWAARHRRRELYVGLPTVMTIAGSKLASGLVERYLAATGYRSQQTNETVEDGRPDNLFEPLPGDPGAHGRFDHWAHPTSLQLKLSMYRRELSLGGLALGGVAALLTARRSTQVILTHQPACRWG